MRNLFLFLLFSSTLCTAQNRIVGVVLNEHQEPLAASVQLQSLLGKVITTSQAESKKGSFILSVTQAKPPYSLIVSHTGYQSDTIRIDSVKSETDLGPIMLLTHSVMLGEVTVQGSNVTVRDGVKRIVPTAFQLQNSTDALVMLDKMNLPRLSVDPLTKRIALNGLGTVKVLINGREASAMEVSALPPSVIKRVDYHDIPEARYGNADVVLDFITRNDEVGGRVYASLWHGVATAFGEDYVAMKLNRKNSQLSIDYQLAYRDWDHLSRSYNEAYCLPNDTLRRTEQGSPGRFEYNNHNINLNYNWQKEERQFNLSMGTGIKNAPYKEWNSDITGTDLSGVVKDNAHTSSFSPYLQAYWQMPVATNQLLYLNLVGLYSDGRFERRYDETNNKNENRSFITNNKEKQKTYGAAAIYESKNNWGTLTLGLDFKQQFVSSDFSYTANGASANHQYMRLTNLYAYAYWGKSWKKLYGRLSFGVNQRETRIGELKQSPLTIRPSAYLRYSASSHWEFTYQGYVANVMPTLAALSVYSQDIDFIQTQKGNPNLKPQVDIYNALMTNYKTNRMNWTLFLNHTYSHHPIMERSYVEANRIVRTQDNHSGFHSFIAELNNGGSLWNHQISYSVFVGLKYYASLGNDYTHHSTIPYYGAMIAVYYKKFMAKWMMNKRVQDRYWGETLYRNEDGHMLTVGYQTNKIRVSADVLNLFAKKHIGAMENFSSVAPYRRYEYLDETRNLIRVNLTLNLSFGKSYQGRQPRLSQSTTTESSIVRGEK